MSIPARLTTYLEERGVHFEIRMHEHSRSSAETARTAQVRPDQLAKSVLLEDEAGCVMAVVPADKTVKVGQLSHLLGRRELHLSDENRIAKLFDDCDRGAVPPVGMAWDVETIVDEELEAAEVVYLEGGDHQHLLMLSGSQFHELMGAALHGRFCKARTH